MLTPPQRKRTVGNRSRAQLLHSRRQAAAGTTGVYTSERSKSNPMNIITAYEAKTLLRAYESENASHLENIDFMSRNNIETEYLTLGNTLIINQLFRGETFTNVCPLGSDWDMEEVLTYLAENRKGSRILIDVQKSDAETKSVLMNRMSETFTYLKTYTDYVLTEIREIAEDPSVRLLTADDRDTFLAMEYTPEQYRPPLSLLFDSFVINKVENGKILAFFEDGRITGSLSLVHQSGAYYTTTLTTSGPLRPAAETASAAA